MIQLRIKEVAAEHNMLLKDICERAGYKSLPSFYRQINNPDKLNMKTLIRIAEVIGCEVKDFFVEKSNIESSGGISITCDNCGNIIKFKRER